MSETPKPPGRPPGSRLTGSNPVPPDRRPTAPSKPTAPAAPAASTAGGQSDLHKSTRSAVLVEEFEKSGGKDNTFKYLLIVCGVLVVGGTILFIMYVGGTAERKEREERARTDAVEAVDTLRAEVTKLVDGEDYDAYVKQVDVLTAMCEKKREIVQQDGYDIKLKKDLRNRIDSMKMDLAGRKEVALGKKRSRDTLKEAEAAVESADKIGSVSLKLQQLKIAANNMDKEFVDRVMAIEGKLELNKLKFSLEKARADAGAASDAENKLRAYEATMDMFKDYFNRSAKPHEQVIAFYKEAVKDWDDLVIKLETPEYEASTPVRDLLAQKERQPGGVWGGTEGVKHEWAGRELVIEGVAAMDKDGKERKLRGVFSIDGWSQKWTDLVMDIEFTIVAGEFDMMLRYRPGQKPYTVAYQAGVGGFNASEAIRMTVRIKGSEVEFEQQNQAKTGQRLQYSVSRNGGIGFAVPKGSKIVISRCDMRVLRPRGGTR